MRASCSPSPLPIATSTATQEKNESASEPPNSILSAAAHGDDDAVSRLIAANAPLEVVNAVGCLCVLFVCVCMSLFCFLFFLDLRAPIRRWKFYFVYDGQSYACAQDLRTFLLVAAERHYVAFVRRLIAAGANVRAADAHGRSALHLAVNGHSSGETPLLVGRSRFGSLRKRVCRSRARTR